MTSSRLTKGATSSKSSAFARLGVSTRSRSLFLRHRQQKCRKLATKCHPRLHRGAGIDIMPRNRSATYTNATQNFHLYPFTYTGGYCSNDRAPPFTPKCVGGARRITAPLGLDICFMEGFIPFAMAQYVAVAGAFALAWVLWTGKWRLFRNILIAWGITWLPVVILSTGDVTASSGGPFNFPMSMFAVPFFAFICLVELGLALIFRAIRSSRGMVAPTVEQMIKQTDVSKEGDRS